MLGSLNIPIPVGMTSIDETLDELSTMGVYIQVVAGLNANTGVATWTLTALDPTTMQIPEDPFLGLLPPDLLPPEGDGSVSYTIRPKAPAATGTISTARPRSSSTSTRPFPPRRFPTPSTLARPRAASTPCRQRKPRRALR